MFPAPPSTCASPATLARWRGRCRRACVPRRANGTPCFAQASVGTRRTGERIPPATSSLRLCSLSSLALALCGSRSLTATLVSYSLTLLQPVPLPGKLEGRSLTLSRSSPSGTAISHDSHLPDTRAPLQPCLPALPHPFATARSPPTRALPFNLASFPRRPVTRVCPASPVAPFASWAA